MDGNTEMTTLSEAIKHCEDVADSYNDTVPDCDCAIEHRQLAEWLRQLKACRLEYVNACKTAMYKTPDRTLRDLEDAYTVMNVLQPIFGKDVTF